MVGGKKILVVDDELNVRKLVSFILTSNGYSAIEASDAEEGIEKAKQEKPDLIVLDVMMPNMDGFEAAQKLRSGKKTKDIPILMLSSRAQFEDKMKGIDAGAMDYITKPFDRNEFLEKIKECLE
ncbi:response regulator [Candidatus Woesearchaeota archaeon]|nr:response regulator [Candidatus Woesearchaeota archaeon]